jgi:CBS domain-containing membrane protein
MGSFGASAVLAYGALTRFVTFTQHARNNSSVFFSSPLAQPRNLVLGNTLSALIGISYWYIFKTIGGYMWIGGALAVSTSIAAMHVTKCVHPPAGRLLHKIFHGHMLTHRLACLRSYCINCST